MLSRGLIALCLASSAVAQLTTGTYSEGTGVRSLWIPFKTVAGTPLASIAYDDLSSNQTIYVVSCPTASPQCAIAPNLTVTEGPSFAGYVTTQGSAVATLGCDLNGTTYAACSNIARGNGDISKDSTTIGASMIVFQAIDITQTATNTSTIPMTVTVTAASTTSTTSSTSTSKAAATMTAAGGSWAMGGAVGAGLLALAAL